MRATIQPLKASNLFTIMYTTIQLLKVSNFCTIMYTTIRLLNVSNIFTIICIYLVIITTKARPSQESRVPTK